MCSNIVLLLVCTVRLYSQNGRAKHFSRGAEPSGTISTFKGGQISLKGAGPLCLSLQEAFYGLAFLTIEVISEGEFGVWNIILICIAILTKNNSRL